MAIGQPKRANLLRQFILENVDKHPRAIARVTAKEFGISRQAAARQLTRLVREGKLIAEGETKGRTYRVGTKREATLKVGHDLAEHSVWEQVVKPVLQDATANVEDICQYGFTEILNNVIDHSGSPIVHIEVEKRPEWIRMMVLDRGIGIFRKIQTAYNLENERLAIFELSKGKLTTDPQAHTGEGIFFTSRMFDKFSIVSGQYGFVRWRQTDDWLIEQKDSVPSGTLVSMEIDPTSEHTTKEVFDQYATEQEDFAFSRTHLGVAMAAAGSKLVSRSQAKRILARLERFREVVLDFKDVDSIGPAFADEIFRVFANEHPEVTLLAINTNVDVERMIQRASHAEREKV